MMKISRAGLAISFLFVLFLSLSIISKVPTSYLLAQGVYNFLQPTVDAKDIGAVTLSDGVSLSWPDLGVDRLKHYQILYKHPDDVVWQVIQVPDNQNFVSIRPLEANAEYYFRVRARFTDGTYTTSNRIEVTTYKSERSSVDSDSHPNPIVEERDIYASPTVNSIALSWTDLGVNKLKRYQVLYKQPGDSKWQVLQVPYGDNQIVVGSLVADTEYYIRIRARFTDGTYTTSNRIEVTTAASNSGEPSSQILYNILSTGQSLAMGKKPPLSVAQPYNNLMLSRTGSTVNFQGPFGKDTPLIPLVENSRQRETPSSGIANTITAFNGGIPQIAIGLHAIGGTEYGGLKKNGTKDAYANGMEQAEATKKEADRLGLKYVPLAVTVIHGERDSILGNQDYYESYLNEFQLDYQNDLSVIAGESVKVPMFISQTSSYYPMRVALSQLSAHIDNPMIIMTGPTYQYPTYDNTHMTNIGYRQHGELMGKVMSDVLFAGKDWNPLSPKKVGRDGKEVYVTFVVPVEPLVFDTETVADRTNSSWYVNKGFQFYDGENLIKIEKVEIDKPNRVKLTLATDQFASSTQYVGYGSQQFQEASNSNPDDPNGSGGNLRDSDNRISPSPDSSNLPLYNWSVIFKVPVGYNR